MVYLSRWWKGKQQPEPTHLALSESMVTSNFKFIGVNLKNRFKTISVVDEHEIEDAVAYEETKDETRIPGFGNNAENFINYEEEEQGEDEEPAQQHGDSATAATAIGAPPAPAAPRSKRTQI